ncbi:MAG: cation diffusion facilitator family transporter [Pseudohongiellaceae bacterium]
MSQTDLNLARTEATRVTVVGMVLDVCLGLLKIGGGMITQSFALITDGIHSLTDALTDIFVLLVARVAHSEADQKHPYGHGRFETLGTIAMGMVFFTTAGILLYDSINRLRSSEILPVPAAAGLLLAALSVAGKEWIYHYTMRVARRLNSSLLKANAWHSRSDAITSIAVFIGIAGALQGFPWLDTVAAMVVALFIARIGYELCADSLRELVDTAVPPERQTQLRNAILDVEGIHGITSLRSRLSGGKIILEAHLLVNPRISVSEGHQLGEQVARALVGRFSDISEVIAHIDPEAIDDEQDDRRESLPPRHEVLQTIRELWRDLLQDDAIQRVSLHYFEHGIEVELLVKLADLPPELPGKLEQALDALPYLAGLRIYNTLYSTRLHPQLPS